MSVFRSPNVVNCLFKDACAFRRNGEERSVILANEHEAGALERKPIDFHNLSLCDQVSALRAHDDHPEYITSTDSKTSYSSNSACFVLVLPHSCKSTNDSFTSHINSVWYGIQNICIVNTVKDKYLFSMYLCGIAEPNPQAVKFC